MWKVFHPIFNHLKFPLKTRRCVRKARSLCRVYHLVRKSLSKMQTQNEAIPFQTIGLVPNCPFLQFDLRRASLRPAGIQQLRKWMTRYKTKAVSKPSNTCRKLRSLPAMFSPPMNKTKALLQAQKSGPSPQRVPQLWFSLPRSWNKIEGYLFTHFTEYQQKKSFCPWAYSVATLYHSIQFLKPISII